MDPLFKAYGTDRYRYRDPSIRYVEEKDIDAVAELFRLNYGEGYPLPDVYDGHWIKRCIHSDHIICVVLELEGEVLATGSVVLNYGDYNDKSGELARLVVHPARSGQGFGRRVIEALFKIAANTLEFAIGECRTAHAFSQEMFEEAGFALIGFLPQFLILKGQRESLALYAKLHGDAEFLRTAQRPRVIPQVAPLARTALRSLSLTDDLDVIDPPSVHIDAEGYVVRPIDRSALGPLLRIPHGRSLNPLLFGNISIEQGFTFVRDKARYVAAFDENQKPVGTLGLQIDKTNRLIKGIELIAENADIWPSLCGALLRTSDDLGAEVVAVDVSAYQPELQKLLFGYGFRPVAYAPAMVFHGIERLDVVKMIKLNVTYNPGEMSLTERARKMVDLVAKNFNSPVS